MNGALPEQALNELSSFGWTVVPDYYKEWQTVAKDLQELRGKDGYFTIAKIGTEIQDANLPFRDIRHSETCVLKRPVMMMLADVVDSNGIGEEAQIQQENMKQEESVLPASSARTHLFEALQGLKHTLLPTTKTSSPANDDTVLEEVMYVYYPVGGYYKRHVDAERNTLSNWRQYSFLLYLTDMESTDGGQLRLHRDSGTQELPAGELPNFLDVIPKGGKLLIFRSDLMPHEVLVTHKERSAVVGWFLTRPSSSLNNDNNTGIREIPITTAPMNPSTLEALRALREAVPSIHDKLEPKTKPIDSSSGLLGDEENDWGIVMDAAPPPPPEPVTAAAKPDDTDPRYWKSIATFDEQGRIVTLGLGGQRLRKLQDSKLLTNLFTTEEDTTALTTLDLANTDLQVDLMVDLLNRVSLSVVQLYLGGMGLGGMPSAGVVLEKVLVPLPNLTVLDLRYNDLGRGSDNTAISALSRFLQTSRVEKLYLEGNTLGDSGVANLVSSSSSSCSTTLRELYLGQNNIGPAGAASLAHHLGNMRKLYLEGNAIGIEGARAFLNVLTSYSSSNNKNNGKQLEKLYVDNNGIPKDEYLALGVAVNSVTMIGTGGLFQE